MTWEQVTNGLFALATVSGLVAWIVFCGWIAGITNAAVGLALMFVPLAVGIFLIGAFGI